MLRRLTLEPRLVIEPHNLVSMVRHIPVHVIATRSAHDTQCKQNASNDQDPGNDASHYLWGPN